MKRDELKKVMPAQQHALYRQFFSAQCLAAMNGDHRLWECYRDVLREMRTLWKLAPTAVDKIEDRTARDLTYAKCLLGLVQKSQAL